MSDRFFPETIEHLQREAQSARAKHPGSEGLLAALMEEVGEVAKAYLENEGEARVMEEATQVAVVALRIVEEGDSLHEPDK